jgi:hypothetical protein
MYELHFRRLHLRSQFNMVIYLITGSAPFSDRVEAFETGRKYLQLRMNWLIKEVILEQAIPSLGIN